MFLLSVIIPVYNAEKYLANCIDSILRQTGFELELILVDDGSTDASPAICDCYMKKDSRVQVLHLVNGGVSHARNVGIQHARGEYITFVDSDDDLENDAYQSCALLLSENPFIDCIIYGFNVIKPDSNKAVIPTQGIYERENFSKPYVELYLPFLINSPCNKIYKRNIIYDNFIIFPEEFSIGEDLIFNNHYLDNCKNIVVLSKALYNYYQREKGSLTTRYHENLFSIYCIHFESIRNTLLKLGESNIDDRISALYHKYTKEAINMLMHPQCILDLMQKYHEIDKILHNTHVENWLTYAKHKDLYWFLMKNHCTIGLFAYLCCSVIKRKILQ